MINPAVNYGSDYRMIWHVGIISLLATMEMIAEYYGILVLLVLLSTVLLGFDS